MHDSVLVPWDAGMVLCVATLMLSVAVCERQDVLWRACGKRSKQGHRVWVEEGREERGERREERAARREQRAESREDVLWRACGKGSQQGHRVRVEEGGENDVSEIRVPRRGILCDGVAMSFELAYV
jgi:hypothetical protein